MKDRKSKTFLTTNGILLGAIFGVGFWFVFENVIIVAALAFIMALAFSQGDQMRDAKDDEHPAQD